jgi:PAS domain S-box-containing protein
VLSRARAVTDASGSTPRLIGTVVDVTEHKRGEEELRRRSSELSQMVKVRTCLYEIAHLLEQAELPLERIYERTIELLPLSWHDPENTFARLEAGGREHRSRGWRETVFQQRVEIPAAGEPVGWLEIGFASLQPEQQQYREEEIQVTRAVATSLGRSVEYKRATESLRRSERRYRSLFDHMMSGCALHEIIADETGKPADFRFLEINPEFGKLVGLRAEAATGKTVREVLPDAGREWIETYGEVALSGRPVRLERYMQGLNRYFEIAAFSPEKGRFAIIIHDITERRRAEAQRAAERNLLRTVIDNVPDSIYVKDTARRYLISNKANLRVLGLDQESQARDKTVFDLFPPEHAELYESDDRTVIESGASVLDREEPYRDANGNARCYLTTKVPLVDANGKVIGLVGISRDITDRKRAEQVLRLAQFSLHHASDAIFWVGPDGSVLYVNDSACTSLGYRREQLLSMKVGDIDENAGEHWAAIWDEVKQAGAVTIESSHVTATGERIPVEANVNYLNFDGKEYHCTFVRDITARKRAEEAMRESRRRMETLLSNLPGMAYRCKNDVNWTMEFVSKGCQELTGLSPTELLAVSFADLIDPEDRAAVWDQTQQAIQQRKPFQLEYRIRTAAGPPKWLWEQGTAVFSDSGEVEALEGFVADISERRQAAEALERKAEELTASNAELEQFAYAASHDLQEPLRMIGGYAQLLARRYRGKLDDQADEFIRFIVEGAERMQTLIRDLLAYSRAARTMPVTEVVDLADCASTSLANLRGVLEENGAAVEVGPLPEIQGQGWQLVQLFQNLIGNALKYHADEPPRVRVWSERRDNDWLFTVEDNGIGIDPQYHGQVFDLFRRLHGRSEYSGTGIGLAICKKIVENHGGRIWVDSEAGRGAAFRFTLPAAQSGWATPVRQAADGAGHAEYLPAAPDAG